MRIAILGTGAVGSVLGTRWANKGHQVIFGALEPDSDQVRLLVEKAGSTASATTVTEAMGQGDVVVLAIPWNAAGEVLEGVQVLTGKIVIDCINPTNSDLSGLEVGYSTSAAEEIARLIPHAQVVKAFNTTGVGSMVDPTYDGQKTHMFICSDNQDAKATVSQLAAELDFEVIDAGTLSAARYLEPFAMLLIHLAVHQGFAADFGVKIFTR